MGEIFGCVRCGHEIVNVPKYKSNRDHPNNYAQWALGMTPTTSNQKSAQRTHAKNSPSTKNDLDLPTDVDLSTNPFVVEMSKKLLKPPPSSYVAETRTLKLPPRQVPAKLPENFFPMSSAYQQLNRTVPCQGRI